MWAPWRMEYILSDKSRGCFMCQAAAAENDRESLVVARKEKVFALLNKYPYNNGHILIAPYRHEGKLEKLTEEELREMTELLVDLKVKLDCIMDPHGYNAGLNLGKASGAGVEDHLHMHLVPRWENDTNFMPVLGETKIIPQHLDELWQQITKEQQG